ncbi:hypothetical protein GCM10010177_49370 [Actinomadura citrea]|nr:hypothetical protein GCM10010177_49370 [Actinomadura citrea]
MGLTSIPNRELPRCDWKMVALVPIPWRDFSARWEVDFEENVEWEAPGPVAHASARGDDSGVWYALEHHYDYPRPGVYFFVPSGTHDPLKVLAEDLGLPVDYLVSMRI